MREVVEMYGLHPNRGNFICCPFHHEKTPSMKIYDKSYHCFGCSLGGKAIDFVMRLFNLDFKSACQKLNDDFNLGIITGRKASRFEVEKAKALQAKRELEKQEEQHQQDLRNGIFKIEDIDPKLKWEIYKKVEEPPFINKVLKYFDRELLDKEQIEKFSKTETKIVLREDVDDELVCRVIKMCKKKYSEIEESVEASKELEDLFNEEYGDIFG
jgi:hypothetical protein